MLGTFRLAAASAVTVAVIASCHREPSPDQGFLDAVHAAGMHSNDGDQKLLELGHEVCHRLNVGQTVQQVTDEVWAGMPHRPLVDQRSPSEFQSDAQQHQIASEFVGDALDYLCPEQASPYHGR